MEPFEHDDDVLFSDVDEGPVLVETTQPVFFGMLANPKVNSAASHENGIYKQLIAEIFEPNPLRSHVITLHLFVEYWLDRILTTFKQSGANRMNFYGKASYLKDKGVLDASLFANIIAINRLRNIYAHELDLEKANQAVNNLLCEMAIDPYFVSNDDDHFRTICVQTMMLLESTLANGCKPPSLAKFPHDETRNKLLKTGQLFWQECEIIGREGRDNITTYQLRCPLCLEGTIKREKDSTPGFKESTMWPCNICGLSGNGSTLTLETASMKYRNSVPKRDEKSV